MSSKVFDPEITPGKWVIDSFGRISAFDSMDCMLLEV